MATYRRISDGLTIAKGTSHTFTIPTFSVPAGERLVRFMVCKAVQVSNMTLQKLSSAPRSPEWNAWETDPALIAWNGGTAKVAVKNNRTNNQSFNVYIDYETEALPKRSVTCKTSGQGTLKANVSTAYEGQVVTLTPTPSTGYKFSTYTSSPSVSISNNKFTMPASAVTITAKFTNQSYNISPVSENSAMGTVSGGGLVPFESSVKIVATPKPGYKFVNWTALRGTIVNPTSAETQFIVSAAHDTTVTAHFERSQTIVKLRDDDEYVDCFISVYDNGIWKDCDAYVYDNGEWKLCSHV